MLEVCTMATASPGHVILVRRFSATSTAQDVGRSIVVFSNLLGCCYRKGNLVFTPDGNQLISPVGNRVSVFDLKNAKMKTLPLEAKTNITSVAISPNGNILIVVDEDGNATMINVSSSASMHIYKFYGAVHCISFSPDGKKVAITEGMSIKVFYAPGQTVEFNPFVLYRSYYGAYDECTCIDWTSDSRAFCVGSMDSNSRVYAARHLSNLVVYSLPSHKDTVIGAFFEINSLDVYSVSRNGQLFVFQCDTELSDLSEVNESSTKSPSDVESDEESNSDSQKKIKATDENGESEEKILYKRVASCNFNEGRDTSKQRAFITCAAYHKRTHILITGFDDGSFTIHEMPDFTLLNSYQIGDVNAISSLAINQSADWVALGSSATGALCVWEWQSESFQLKQQSHFGSMACLAYSPDGQYIATGGDDAKVKVWKTIDGFCFITFTAHVGQVTGVAFSQRGNVVVSSSRDGTVRAFDMNKYRNFRTFTNPEGREPCQFVCLALDRSGEIVVAGTEDSREIYVWSMQTGKLLEILVGHEGPVSCLAFSTMHSTLASGSWDHTIRFWDVFTSKGARSMKVFSTDVLALAYRPDGAELAVATLGGNLSFLDVQTEEVTRSIEGHHDIGNTRCETDKITAKKASEGKSFRTLCYTADGKHLLAAGQSKNICIYSVENQILAKKFEITCNKSFDGTEEFLDRRKMTEWGSLALVDEGQGDVNGKSISLPGVKAGDMCSRLWKPEVRVSCVHFSPTGRAFAATTTEGLLVYSLDHNVIFDPFELGLDVTPDKVKLALRDKRYVEALLLAFRLNEHPIICLVVEQIPPSEIDYICRSLPNVYIDKLLAFVASRLETSAEKGFYVTWNEMLLVRQGIRLKQRSLSVMPAVRTVQKSLRSVQDLNKIHLDNKYMLRYQKCVAELVKQRRTSCLGDELSVREFDSETNSDVDVSMSVDQHDDSSDSE